MSSWILFIRYVFSARAGALVRRIAWLCVISTTVSVAAFVVVSCVRAGLNKNIQERLRSVEPHLLVNFDEVKDSKLLKIHPVLRVIEDFEGVKAFPIEIQDVIIRTNDGLFKGAVGRGVESESLKHLYSELNNLAKKNSNVTYEMQEPGAQEIVIGVDLARSLGVFEGDQVSIVTPESLLLPAGEIPKIEKVRVKQIITTNIADIDNQIFYYNPALSLRHLKSSASHRLFLEVWTQDESQATEVKNTLSSFAGVHTQSWQERNSALFLSLKLEKIVMGVFLGLSALITGFSFISVLSILLSHKRSDMAIMQVMGMSKKRIEKMFFLIGLWLAAIGLGTGFIIGLMISFYLQLFPMELLPDIYYDSQIPAQVQPMFIFSIFVLLSIFAWLSAWLPTRSIKKMEILSAL